MPINVIGFAVAKVEADKRGVGDREATRIGVIGSVMANPIMSLVVARSIADKEAPAEQAASTQASPVITLPPPKPPRDPKDPGATGGVTGGGTNTAGGSGTGSGGTVTLPLVGGGVIELAVDPSVFKGMEEATKGLHEEIDTIRDRVTAAENAAEQGLKLGQETKDALGQLTQTVKDGFQRIEQQLPPPPPPPVAASPAPAGGADPAQQPTAKGKGTGGSYKP